LGSLIVIAAMFLLLWLLLIRPQRAAAAKRQAVVDSVDVGDEILTSGGMYATVTGVGDETDELFVEIAEGVEVRIDRRSVGAIVRKDEDETDEKEESDEVEEESGADAESEDQPMAETADSEEERAEPVVPDRRYPS
jgi:preprotein translocase subunit YajC